jgi:hypothetical protein
MPPCTQYNVLLYVLLTASQIRESGVPAVVVRPCALTEEPLGAPLEIDQGDVIKVSKEPMEGVMCLAAGTRMQIQHKLCAVASTDGTQRRMAGKRWLCLSFHAT